MRRFALLVGMVMACGVVWGADNRPISPEPVSPIFKAVDEGYRVRFTTTIPKNVNTLILGRHTAQELVVPSGVEYTTGTVDTWGAVSSTSPSLGATNGGRLYFAFQVVDTTGSFKVDIGTVNAVNSPYYTAGQWVVFDDPLAVQEPIRGIALNDEATITGWFWTHKRR